MRRLAVLRVLVLGPERVHRLIDDVRIYDRALTPSELQQLATP